MAKKQSGGNNPIEIVDVKLVTPDGQMNSMQPFPVESFTDIRYKLGNFGIRYSGAVIKYSVNGEDPVTVAVELIPGAFPKAFAAANQIKKGTIDVEYHIGDTQNLVRSSISGNPITHTEKTGKPINLKVTDVFPKMSQHVSTIITKFIGKEKNPNKR